MIENLRSIAPLGKSDHVGLLFTFITYSAIDSRVLAEQQPVGR